MAAALAYSSIASSTISLLSTESRRYNRRSWSRLAFLSL